MDELPEKTEIAKSAPGLYVSSKSEEGNCDHPPPQSRVHFWLPSPAPSPEPQPSRAPPGTPNWHPFAPQPLLTTLPPASGSTLRRAQAAKARWHQADASINQSCPLKSETIPPPQPVLLASCRLGSSQQLANEPCIQAKD